jgi:hypothetical protein
MVSSTLLLVLCSLAVFVAAKECDRDGYWGDDCNKICGTCATGVCDKKSGKCEECADKWVSGQAGEKLCNVPTCFGKENGCDQGGKCIAPDYCICGEQGAQVVGKEVTRGEITGIDCVSLRWDGIKGAAIAMVVMFTSIGICGGIERVRNRVRVVKTD